MAFLLCNNVPVVWANIELNSQGNWHASLRVDSDKTLSGNSVLSWQNSTKTWTGTVTSRSGEVAENGPSELILVGGKNKLSKILKGNSYRQVTVRVLLQQIAEESGEKIAATTDTSLLSRLLSRWSRLEGSASSQISQIASFLGVSWRVLTDGSITLEARSNDVFVPPKESEIVLRNPQLSQVYFKTNFPFEFAPRGTFEGKRIDSVQIAISAYKSGVTLCLS